MKAVIGPTAGDDVMKTAMTVLTLVVNLMRTTNPADMKGPFLYSASIDVPRIENTDFLFIQR
jgi:hypothetical protein